MPSELARRKASTPTIKTFISKFLVDDFFIDMIRVALYPADFGTITVGSNNSTIEYVMDFLKDLNQVAKNLKLGNLSVIQNNIALVTSLINIRETGMSILNYDNVFQHFPSQDLNTQRLIKAAIDRRLHTMDEFRKTTDYQLNMIAAYYESSQVSAATIAWEQFVDYSGSPDVTIFEAHKLFKDAVINIYNDLSKLQSVSKSETFDDYFVISNKHSVDQLADTLFKYISTGYSFYKTGFTLFDQYIEGFESSSVHLISAPSNHGKSILMVNLLRSIIEANISEFKSNDVIVFVTLEDDIYKLTRRFMSVFGNVKHSNLRLAFKQFYEISKAHELTEGQSTISHKIQSMLKNLIYMSILNVTNEKVAVCLRHENENTFSPGDLGKFLDKLRVEGLNPKMVFMDYVDCAQPTIQRYSHVKDYDMHGQIVQELRNLSRVQKLPIVTATQNAKISENMNIAMDNTQIGDSYKKVRYSDFIYMCRMRKDLNPLTPPVIDHITDGRHKADDGSLTQQVLQLQNMISSVLIPFEIKITKSKESGKDVSRYSLFCEENLKIYNNIQEYIDDAQTLYKKSKRLEDDIKHLTDMAITSVTETFDQDVSDGVIPLPTAVGADNPPDFLS